MRHLRQLKPHLHTRERAHQREVVEIAEVSDAEYFVGDFPKAAAERHIEIFQHDFTERGFAVAFRHAHGGEYAGVLRFVLTLNFQPPRVHRTARGFGMAVVAFEYVVEAFLFEHGDAFAQAVEQVGGGRVREVASFVGALHFVP